MPVKFPFNWVVSVLFGIWPHSCLKSIYLLICILKMFRISCLRRLENLMLPHGVSFLLKWTKCPVVCFFLTRHHVEVHDSQLLCLSLIGYKIAHTVPYLCGIVNYSFLISLTASEKKREGKTYVDLLFYSLLATGALMGRSSLLAVTKGRGFIFIWKCL